MKILSHRINSRFSKLAPSPMHAHEQPTRPAPKPNVSREVNSPISKEELKEVIELIPPSIPQKKSVLVADDNFANQLVVKTLLSRAGYSVTCVNSGREAIVASQVQPYCLILMDIEMPDGNGIEATEYIRSSNSPNRETQIIALTAHGSAQERQTYLKSGMDNVLTKPFKMNDLQNILDSNKPCEIKDNNTGSAIDNTQEQELISSILALPFLELTTLDLLVESAGVERLKPIITTYWQSAYELLDDLKKAQHALDRDSFKRSAHTLKGASANIGLMQVGRLAAQLQNARSDMTTLYLDALDITMARSRTALSQYLNRAQ